MQSLRIANSRMRGDSSEPIDYGEALAELSKLTDERAAKWETVLLLGNSGRASMGRLDKISA